MTNKNIKTKYDDALAVLNNKALADKLAQKEFARRVGKSDTSELIIKAKTTRECPSCGATMTMDEVDCPECGKMVGKANVKQIPLPEELDPDEIQDNTKELTTSDDESDLDESKGKTAKQMMMDKAEVANEESSEDSTMDEDEAAEDESTGNKKKMAMQTEAMPEMMLGKHSLGQRKKSDLDPLLQDASEALEVVQKAINAPGGNKGELLAQAATLVNAIRDYAHSIAGAPEVAGAVTAEAVAATQDLNPAPQPGQKVGDNQPVVAEDEVKERPQVSEDQEEAIESPEEAADETPEDEVEEGRLHFAKQPNNENKRNAMKPPMPVGERVKARTQADAVVKSVAMHPTEAFLNKWATALVPALKSAILSRSAKREAVQKALNEFGPAVVRLIDDVTPAAESDLTLVVQNEVNKALAEKDSQYQAIIEQLQQQVTVLNAAITSREVKANLPSRTRKSLQAMSPQQPIQKALETHVLAGDQVPIRKFTAAEIAQASIAAGNQILRY